jgi:hypothetical protein
MYAVTLKKNEDTRRFSITATESSGWEVREEQNSQLISRQLYTDWHRVERAQMGFALAVGSLVDEGWIGVGGHLTRTPANLHRRCPR